MDVRFLQEDRSVIRKKGSVDQGEMPPRQEKRTFFFPEPRSSFDTIRLLSGSYLQCWSSWTVRDLQYSYHRLYYVCSGTAWYIVDGKRYRLKPYHLYILPTYPRHYRMEHDPEDPLEVLWCHFEIQPQLTNDLIEYDPKNDLAMLATIDLWRQMEALHQSGNEMYHTISLLLHVLERKVTFCYPQHHLAEVEQYMNEHIQEHLRVQEIAARFGYSRSHFCRVFTEAFNMSPGRYMQIRRMSLASEMLRGGAGIDEICTALGFTDKKTFFRAFKSYYGITTTQFRIEHKMQP